MISRAHLEAFLEIADRRSIQAAARATGKSRATYHRYLAELRTALDAPELFRRAPGQREGVLTAEGEALVQRARLLLKTWDQWVATTRDALAKDRRRLRVGAIAGSFDLITDLLIELRAEEPGLPLKVFEYTSAQLLDRVEAGEVDLGFGTLPSEGVPERLRFERLGLLELALIAPKSLGSSLPDPVSLEDLPRIPMVVPRSGAARESLDRQLADHPSGPLFLDAVCEVESAPRMVELVARGFGAAVVSRFRLAFLPKGVVVRTLAGGPPPLEGGVFTRRGVERGEIAERLISRARARFEAISTPRQRR